MHGGTIKFSTLVVLFITVTYFINSDISCTCFVKTEYKLVFFKSFVQLVCS
jgi:hypothetical protein